MAEGRLGQLQDALGFALAVVLAVSVTSGAAFLIWFNVTADSRAHAACRKSGGTVAIVPDRPGTPGWWECDSG